ncbi:MAG TPA: hypothetical protein VGX76_03445 [Pirellulales bacterium]|nr:hypothetical protein [Pirellulales bacterium]
MSTPLNTPVQVLAQSINQGTVFSASLAVPAGAKQVSVDGIISAADAANPLSNINLVTLFFCYDAQGLAWMTEATQQWNGIVGGNPISLQIGLQARGGQPVTFVKMSYDIPASAPLSVGATLTFLP